MLQNTIRVERARKRITQAELAEKLKVSRQTIHSIETGRYVPSATLALRIARFFKLPIEDVFQLEDS
jgi:putative transcriptional regulator